MFPQPKKKYIHSQFHNYSVHPAVPKSSVMVSESPPSSHSHSLILPPLSPSANNPSSSPRDFAPLTSPDLLSSPVFDLLGDEEEVYRPLLPPPQVSLPLSLLCSAESTGHKGRRESARSGKGFQAMRCVPVLSAFCAGREHGRKGLERDLFTRERKEVLFGLFFSGERKTEKERKKEKNGRNSKYVRHVISLLLCTKYLY